MDMPLIVKQVVYHGFGDSDQVLSLQESTIYPENLGSTEVLVRWIAAPVNPADLMQFSGEYGWLPTSFPTVAGTEGCGVVEKAGVSFTFVGSKVTNMTVGAYVIPQSHGVGTWRAHGIHESAHLISFGKGLPTCIIATMLANPPTAYRLLKDFVYLKKDDVVVQNGANSAVGKYVIHEFDILDEKDSDDFAANALEKVVNSGQVLGGFSQPFQAVLRACLGKSDTRPTAIELLEVDVIRNAKKEALETYVAECLSVMKERKMI